MTTDEPKKTFRLRADEIVDLIAPMGGCMATDMITVDGCRVGYMVRGKPVRDLDSGWRFFSGEESQEYLDDLSHSGVYAVNTIANYDPTIIPFLDAPIGSAFSRDDEGHWQPEPAPPPPKQ